MAVGDNSDSFPCNPSIKWVGVRCDSMSEAQLRGFLSPNNNYGIEIPSDMPEAEKDEREKGIIEFGQKISNWMKD